MKADYAAIIQVRITRGITRAVILNSLLRLHRQAGKQILIRSDYVSKAVAWTERAAYKQISQWDTAMQAAPAAPLPMPTQSLRLSNAIN